ncbi:uncharacterized protein ACN427_005116 [Glossina fuscipes fuscipes]
MMASLWKSLLFLTAVVQLSLAAYPVVPFQPNVANLFLTAHDPAKAMSCFADYMTNANDINEKYSKDYNQCILNAKSEREKLEEETVAKKALIIEVSLEVWERLNECNNKTNNMDTFKCHAKAGALNSKDVYVISGNSSDYVSALEESYRIIDLRHEQCSKSAERAYVQASAVNYGQLQDCLEGKVPTPAPTLPPLTHTTTSAFPAMTSTTPKPTTTDPIPSSTTDDSSTSDAPTDSPDARAMFIENSSRPKGPFQTGQYAKLLNLLK